MLLFYASVLAGNLRGGFLLYFMHTGIQCEKPYVEVFHVENCQQS